MDRRPILQRSSRPRPRRETSLTGILGAVAAVATLAACQPPPAAPVTAAALAAPPRSAPPRFSGQGCAVNLGPGWAQASAAEATQSAWSVRSDDGRQELTVLAMPWRPRGAPADWRPDLDAVINLRRAADTEEHGARAVLSTPEFIADRVSPAELYLLSDTENGDTLATMAKASTARVCVLFLTRNNAQPGDFLAYARSVLAATVVDP
jgi:hypothetical protein